MRLIDADAWTPVTERLPEHEHNVLLFSDTAGGIVGEGYYSTSKNEWVQYRWNSVMHKVTHWMPLPQPPKGE